MTSESVSLESISEQVDGLSDLFRRRLLEDRAKQAIIVDLQQRLTQAEERESGAEKKPLVESLALVIERIEGAEPTESLVHSLVSELEYVLEAVVGATVIDASPGDPIDPLRVEVASVTGEGPVLRVHERLRRGYELNGLVLRPAMVSASRSEPESDVEPDTDAVDD